MRYNLLIALFAIVLITAALAVVYSTFTSFDPDTQCVSPPNARDYRYHFVLIAQATEESYLRQVYHGMAELIRREKVGMEFYGLNLADHQETKQVLEMAVLAQTDGILLATSHATDFQPLLTEAAVKKIPLVTLANALETAERVSFVGVTAYDLGFRTGQAFQQAVSKPTAAALLINSNFSKASNSQYLKGFQQAIHPYPKLRIGLIVNSKGESISAEEQTQTILRDHPEIQAIICSNPNDTLGVAKLVVDLNRVSQITIIGAGLTTEIANYLRRQVIRSVLADDPAALGAQGLAALLRLVDEPSGLETYQMPLYLIHAQNVDYYVAKFALRRKDRR
jgi:ribose transport system substrate-binding protein